MSNTVILRSVFKINKAFFQPCKDPKTNQYTENVRRQDAEGNLILSEQDKTSNGFFLGENDLIEVIDGKEFNLDNEVDLITYNAIKHSPRIARSRYAKNDKGEYIIDGNQGMNARYGYAIWYEERPGVETQIANKKDRTIHQAKSFIYDDAPEDRRIKAEILGKYILGVLDSDIEDFLIRTAEKQPERVIQLYTGSDFNLRAILVKGIRLGLVKKVDGVFTFGDTILGSSEDTSILFLKQKVNKSTRDLLEREITSYK